MPSPLSNLEGVISYDYTLDQQGLKSNVTCSYAQTNPFSFAPLYNSNFTTSYNVNCTDQGKMNALTNVAAIRSTWTSDRQYASLLGLPGRDFDAFLYYPSSWAWQLL